MPFLCVYIYLLVVCLVVFHKRLAYHALHQTVTFPPKKEKAMARSTRSSSPARNNRSTRRGKETTKAFTLYLFFNGMHFVLSTYCSAFASNQTTENRERYGFDAHGDPLPDVKGRPYSRLKRDGYPCSEVEVLHSWITKEGWLAKYSGGQPGKPGTRKKVVHLEICKDIAERSGYYRHADNIGHFLQNWASYFNVHITSFPYRSKITGNIQVISYGRGITSKDRGRSFHIHFFQLLSFILSLVSSVFYLISLFLVFCF